MCSTYNSEGLCVSVLYINKRLCLQYNCGVPLSLRSSGQTGAMKKS